MFSHAFAMYSLDTLRMSSPSLITSLLLLSCPWAWGSSFSSWFHSSWFSRQKLWRTAQATGISLANEILLTSHFSSIHQCFFSIPKAHSTATLAPNKALLKALSSGSLVASGNGFWSQEASGYALSPPRWGLISLSPTYTESPVRIWLCSARSNIVLFCKTLASCILLGKPDAKSRKCFLPSTVAWTMKSCFW